MNQETKFENIIYNSTKKSQRNKSTIIILLLSLLSSLLFLLLPLTYFNNILTNIRYNSQHIDTDE